MDRKLRKMRKIELLELLLEQEKEIERLQIENSKLQEQLEIRRLQIEESGSIAEAALKLSGIFEAAQKAADIYLESVTPASEDTKKVEELHEETETADSGD